MKKVIDFTTEAAETDLYIAMDTFVSLGQKGLAGTETVKLQADFGGSYEDVIPAIELTVDSNYIQVAGPGTYRLVKSATAAPAAVYIGE